MFSKVMVKLKTFLLCICLSEKVCALFISNILLLFSFFLFSTMSCSLNAVAGTIYEDFVTVFYKSEKHAPTILKFIVVILGTLCVTLVFAVEHLGGVLQVSNAKVLV